MRLLHSLIHPQGSDFWKDIAEPNRGANKLKEALDLITAAMDLNHCICLRADGSSSVRDHDDSDIHYFHSTESLVKQYLAPPPKFDHWDLLQDRFKWMAKDYEGNWWVYEDRPVQSDLGWRPNGSFRSLGSLKIEIPCHWTKSLIKRPSAYRY